MKFSALLFVLWLPIILTAQETFYIDKASNICTERHAFKIKKVFRDSTENNNVLVKTFNLDYSLISAGFYHPDSLLVKNGSYFKYDYRNNLAYKYSYILNKKHGKQYGYFPSGKLRRQEYYYLDSLVVGKCFDEGGVEVEYYPDVVYPKFSAKRFKSINDFISRKHIYSEKAKVHKIEGTVYVRFFIETDHSMTELEIVKSDSEYLNKPVLKAVRKSSKYWTCGRVEGRPARLSYLIPCRIKLL